VDIVFCSELIPVYDSDYSVTPALIEIVKFWDVQVKIFRPYNFFTKNPSSKLNKRKFFYRTKVDKFDVLHIPMIKVPFFRRYLTLPLSFILKKAEINPDIFVGHSMLGNYYAYKCGIKQNRPFTIGLHHSDIHYIAHENRYYTRMLNDASLIVCRSEIIASRLKTLIKAKLLGKIYIAHSGIPLDSIAPNFVFENKAKQIAENKTLRLITVARLQKLKNIDVTIRALSQIDHIDWEFTIIGDGEEQPQINLLIQQLNLSSKIKLTGWLTKTEIELYLNKANCFIMISAPETLGLAYLEAMTKGCIIIGAKGWGIDGIVTNEHNGFLIEHRNERHLISLLNKLDSFDLTTINNNAYQTIVKFDEIAIAQKYLEAILSIIKKKRH
jgi:L-malate glycosyltransferase